jgi:hypothetical protein
MQESVIPAYDPSEGQEIILSSHASQCSDRVLWGRHVFFAIFYAFRVAAMPSGYYAAWNSSQESA